MSQAMFFCLTAGALFGIGLYGFLVYDHLVRKILAGNIMGSAVFLMLVALARRDPTAIDPIPHAMVLTGIVIAISTTAFALALTRRLYRQTGTVRLPEDEPEDRT